MLTHTAKDTSVKGLVSMTKDEVGQTMVRVCAVSSTPVVSKREDVQALEKAV